MENENNNYSFTPIIEDNSVSEIKNDFFGRSEPEVPTEVPPVLENINNENLDSQEQIEITSDNNVEEVVNNNPESPTEPVEIKVPEGLESEEKESESLELVDNNPETNNLQDSVIETDNKAPEEENVPLPLEESDNNVIKEEKEPEVKEIVVEKEKIVVGKKCPNCGELTSEDFCPNCGFLVE